MIRVNAVLGKELTTRMRGWRAAAVVTAYLALLAIVSLIVLSTVGTPTSYSDSAKLGQTLFAALAIVQLILIVLVTPASTADAISGERQRQTLELLLVTRLSSLSVVLGKLVAGLAFDVLLILCSLPLFSLVFLFGGVGLEQVVAMFIVFLGTTLVLGSMSIFISTVTRRSGLAVIASLVWTLILTVGLGVLTLYVFANAQGINAQNVGSYNGGNLTVPLIGYADPLTGFVAVLAGYTHTDGLTQASVGSIGPRSLWGGSVVADALLSVVFVLGSVYLLRPRYRRLTPASPRPPRGTQDRVPAVETGTAREV